MISCCSHGAGCKGTLIGFPHAKSCSGGLRKIDGQAKFVIEDSVQMGLKDRVGSDYVVSAALVVCAETKVVGQNILGNDRSGGYAQTNATMEPFVSVEKVEVIYLLFFSKKDE